MIKNHLINVVATPLWGVCIFQAARSGRRTAPWLQRVRIYEMAVASSDRSEAEKLKRTQISDQNSDKKRGHLSACQLSDFQPSV